MAFQEVSRTNQPHTRPNHSGELHWNARLSLWDRADILRRCEQGEAYSTIATSYGISRMQVSRIHRKVQRANG